MKLIYTFDSKVNTDPSVHRILKKYYEESITRAKKLGYYTEIYSDVDWFNSVADKVNFIANANSLLWDAYKFIPLYERIDDFILLDGDIFLDRTIEIPDKADLVCDTYETKNWNLLYSKTVRKLSELGIESIIPEWDCTPRPVISCGLLYFANKEFQFLYTDKWKKVNMFVSANREHLDLYSATATSAQFLLTLLADYNNFKVVNLAQDHGVHNGYYIHHAGKNKLKNQDLKLNYTVI